MSNHLTLPGVIIYLGLFQNRAWILCQEQKKDHQESQMENIQRRLHEAGINVVLTSSAPFFIVIQWHVDQAAFQLFYPWVFL